MSLCRIIYVSEKPDKISLEDIQDIWYTSMQKNQENAIHGILLYKKKRFVQVLEGETGVVSETFDKIKKDTRHKNIKLLGKESIDTLNFIQWSMGYLLVDDRNNDVLSQYLPNDFTPERLSYADANAMLLDLAKHKDLILDINSINP